MFGNYKRSKSQCNLQHHALESADARGSYVEAAVCNSGDSNVKTQKHRANGLKQ